MVQIYFMQDVKIMQALFKCDLWDVHVSEPTKQNNTLKTA